MRLKQMIRGLIAGLLIGLPLPTLALAQGTQTGAPVASQTGAPVASQTGAPVASQTGAPVASQTGAPVAAPALPPATARVVVDGIELVTDVPPQIVNNRTLVPFRAIAEALGVTVKWDGATSTILATGQGRSLKLVLGEATAWVNGEPRTLDVVPQLIGNRTMVPARLFAEAFGAKVSWEPDTRTAVVWSAVRSMRSLVFYGLGSYEWRGFIPRFGDVAFTWSSINAAGDLDLQYNEYYWPEGAAEVLQLARTADTRRHLAVVAGDRDDRLTRLVLDPAGRERLAVQIEAAVRTHPLEGVVIDLEGLGFGLTGDQLTQVRRGFVDLVSQVSERLRPLRKEVIVAVHPPNGWYPGYDYPAIAAHADFVLVMAYEYVQSGAEPLDKVDEAIQMSLLAGLPAEKLLLGILAEHENRESMVQKVALAKRYNLSGIGVWIIKSLDQEEMEAIESLITPTR